MMSFLKKFFAGEKSPEELAMQAGQCGMKQRDVMGVPGGEQQVKKGCGCGGGGCGCGGGGCGCGGR